jgi:hypothetical protein
MPETQPPTPAAAQPQPTPSPPPTSPTTTPPPSATSAPQAKPDATEATPDGEPSLLSKEAEAPPPRQGAPEKYEFKAPEGFDLDEASINEVTPVFKNLKLSNDEAQSLVDLYAKISKEAAEAPVKFWKETQQKWLDEVRADPEIGDKIELVKTTVNKALATYLSPTEVANFRHAMNYTGAGNNPTFIRVLYKLTSQLVEGGEVRGGGPVEVRAPNAASRPSAAEAMFPNLAQR